MLDNPLIGDMQLSCVDQFPTMCSRISGTNPPHWNWYGQWRSQDIADARAQCGQTMLFARSSAWSAEPFREVWSMLSHKPFAASQVGSKAILWWSAHHLHSKLAYDECRTLIILWICIVIQHHLISRKFSIQFANRQWYLHAYLQWWGMASSC